MAAVRKIYAENRVSVLNRSKIDRHVCLRATVWLHVSMIGFEKFFGAIDRGLFDDVGPFATAVITFAGIAFGILVREDGAHSLQHGFADTVLAGDQFETVSLASDF